MPRRRKRHFSKYPTASKSQYSSKNSRNTPSRMFSGLVDRTDTWVVTTENGNHPARDTVIISNLDQHAVNRDRLLEHLYACLSASSDSTLAIIVGLRMAVHPRTGALSSNALVLTPSDHDAQTVIQAVDGTELEGKILKASLFSKGSIVLKPSEKLEVNTVNDSRSSSPAQRSVKFAKSDEIRKIRYFTKDPNTHMTRLY